MFVFRRGSSGGGGFRWDDGEWDGGCLILGFLDGKGLGSVRVFGCMVRDLVGVADGFLLHLLSFIEFRHVVCKFLTSRFFPQRRIWAARI